MKRYFTIYWMLIKINFSKMFAYRANTVNGLVSSMVWSSFVIFSIVLLTSKTSHIFGWTRDELLVLAGTYNIVYGIFYLFFSRNFEEFSTNIHFGKLDALLTKPIDSQFLMTCWYVGYPNLFRFLSGVIFTVYMLLTMHVHITFITVLSFCILLFFAVIMLYSFWLLIMTLVIWFTRLSNLIDLLYQINGITRYPREMYQGGSGALLFLVFPLTFIIISPAKVLLQKALAGDVIWLLIFSCAFFFLSRKFWKFALRHYTSASS